MQEKKLTDEEIAKAILQQIEYNKSIPYINEWKEIKVIKFTDVLDFIHRLQERVFDYENLESHAKKLELENIEQKEIIEKQVNIYEKLENSYGKLFQDNSEQKAEIERLTEVRNAFRQEVITLNNEKLELQKQVDILQESHYITYERAVKTTAQKILQDLFYFIDGNNFWLEETGNQVFLIKENDALNFMRKKASEYEVEVEE